MVEIEIGIRGIHQHFRDFILDFRFTSHGTSTVATVVVVVTEVEC